MTSQLLPSIEAMEAEITNAIDGLRRHILIYRILDGGIDFGELVGHFGPDGDAAWPAIAKGIVDFLRDVVALVVGFLAIAEF